jgi:nitrate/nitrite-specific signal transduction histidine kinase
MTTPHLRLRYGWVRGNDATEKGHYGLHIIDERIQSLGGKVQINSTPGQGTEVMFWLPVSAPEKDQSEF